ncbi:MAG TPA: hypothetical protein VMB49_04835 [Acidobacteriaceae bacterium]|nr:hypothetical protein [Acidobacteriaceae bacterium]
MDKLINFPAPRQFRNYQSLLRELEPVPLADDLLENAPFETPAQQTPPGDPILCSIELPLRRVFYPLGFAFEIVTNSQSVLNAAAESWHHTKQLDSRPALQLRLCITDHAVDSCPATPVVRGQQHLLSIVADADNQAICDLEAGYAFGWLTLDALGYTAYLRYHFLEAIALILIASSRATPIHGACVSRFGHGMLLCGPSGAGKSTLAYACARSGWTFISDDSSYLRHDRDGLGVVGNSHQVRFRPSAKELFPEIRGRNITPRAEGKPSIEVPTAELPGIIAADEAEVHSILLLNRWPCARAELLPLPAAAAQDYFQQSLQLPGKVREQQVRALKRLSSAAVYELRYQDLQHAVHCLDLLAKPKGPSS